MRSSSQIRILRTRVTILEVLPVSPLDNQLPIIVSIEKTQTIQTLAMSIQAITIREIDLRIELPWTTLTEPMVASISFQTLRTIITRKEQFTKVKKETCLITSFSQTYLLNNSNTFKCLLSNNKKLLSLTIELRQALSIIQHKVV